MPHGGDHAPSAATEDSRVGGCSPPRSMPVQQGSARGRDLGSEGALFIAVCPAASSSCLLSPRWLACSLEASLQVRAVPPWGPSLRLQQLQLLPR